MIGGEENLKAMFARADKVDLAEGLLAYQRYHRVIHDMAAHWGTFPDRTLAAFVALSPNNDYVGNLRSLASCLEGVMAGKPVENVKVSTYNHCRDRAYSYLLGRVNFLDDAKGLKIRNFYHNVLCPDSNLWVTVDGHICAVWRGERLTMKEAIVKGKHEYNEIANAIKRLAFSEFMLPNQYQTVLWFTRKRTLGIKVGSAMQHDWLMPSDDMWKTYHNVDEIKPYK